jgi:hypothetical protein
MKVWGNIRGYTRRRRHAPYGGLASLLYFPSRRSASLAKCSALLKDCEWQVNGLRRRCCEGVMFLDWSTVGCSLLLCYYGVQGGTLHTE